MQEGKKCELPTHIFHDSYHLIFLSFRFDLHLSYSTVTYVINSAMCDFIYCIFHWPIYAIAFLNQSPPIKNPLFCQITAYFRNIVVYAGYMFFGMTALARLAKTTKISISSVHGRILASLVWIYAIIICSPQIPKVRF